MVLWSYLKYRFATWDVRLDNVKNYIVDEKLLGKIANSDPSATICLAALRKLYKVRAEAAFARIGYIHTQAELASIVTTETDSLAQWFALRKLTDQNVLAKVAKLDTYPEVRWCAIQNISDNAILSSLAGTESESIVRGAIIAKLKKSSTLPAFSDVYKSWHRDQALCDTCDARLYAPDGYIGIPLDSDHRYLLCESCFEKDWLLAGENYSPRIAKKRAWVWWQKGEVSRYIFDL